MRTSARAVRGTSRNYLKPSRLGLSMIAGVGSVAVLVRDAKASAAWYQDKLGFEMVGSEGHAVFVRPRGAPSPLVHLCEECDSWQGDRPGGPTGVWLRCGEVHLRKAKSGEVIPASEPEDVERTYRDLKAKGVKFSEDLQTFSWGKRAAFLDPDGNEFEIS